MPHICTSGVDKIRVVQAGGWSGCGKLFDALNVYFFVVIKHFAEADFHNCEAVVILSWGMV